MINERIMPMPRTCRQLLVQRFWNGPENLRDRIIDDKTNEHCLIRPYLGRRRVIGGEAPSKSVLKSLISLRNYPLHIDQIEDLGLPAAEYASAMADTLAFLLWGARIDACDVEFVLARPRPRNSQPATWYSIGNRSFTPGVLGPHALWVLDFDCCRELTMDEKGVKRAAERFWRNDPFYPNPDCKCEDDQQLWDLFKDRFLDTSRSILQGADWTIQRLPGQLVARIIETVGVYTTGIPR
jgi:hypothetical protein